MQKSLIVVGLGFGDEGKGSWVDHLVREHGIKYVVRMNGGAQALHYVVTPQGVLHGFAQFASGMFVPETITVHSRFMLIEPQALLSEAQSLQRKGVYEPLSRMIVSEDAAVITPFNRLLNRIQEISRGGSRHGSCGFGIGLTQQDVETLGEQALYVRDLQGCKSREKLVRLREMKLEQAKLFENEQNRDLVAALEGTDIDFYVRMFNFYASSVEVVPEARIQQILRENSAVFEGAQGVLLDQDYGFFPHCTRSTTTFKNALTLLDEAGFSGETTKIGLLRSYATRHGAGPFVTQDADLVLPACNNQTNDWQGTFRIGWFDSVAARYALEVVGGVDQLALTNIDRLNGLSGVKFADAYEHGDERFFSPNRIHVLDPNLNILAERTNTMQQIVPRYSELPGWDSPQDSAMLGYIEALERELDHPIVALSTRPDHQKIYRNGSVPALRSA